MRDTRVNELHRRLSKGLRITAKDFAIEFGVAERTICRDLSFMLKKGFPIKVDPDERTWHYDGTAVALPAEI